MAILQKKDININLVMTDMNLPDIRGLEFVKIIEKETRLPIVMMCDASDQHTVIVGLTSGAAMLGLVKPLSHHDIKNLWQFSILKRREVLLRSCEPPIEIPESSGSRSKKRKMEEEISRGVAIGQIQAPRAVNFQATPSIVPSPPTATNNNHGVMYRRVHNPLISLMLNPHSRDQLKRIVMGARLRWEAQHGISVPGVRTMNNFAPVQGYPHQPSILPSRNVIGSQLRQGSQRDISVNITFDEGQPRVSLSTNTRACTLHNFSLGQNHPQEPFIQVPSAPPQSFKPVPSAPPQPQSLPILVPIGLATKIEHFVYALLNANYGHPQSMVAVSEPQGGDYQIGAADMLDAVLQLLDD